MNQAGGYPQNDFPATVDNEKPEQERSNAGVTSLSELGLSDVNGQHLLLRRFENTRVGTVNGAPRAGWVFCQRTEHFKANKTTQRKNNTLAIEPQVK